MSTGRDTIRDALIAAISVVIFIAFLVVAGTQSTGTMSTTGAYLIVGGIVAFILSMAAIGILFLGD
ncbi:MAG: hypothetical protein ABEJ55_00715 [Halanaeroarchaeum sp.]